MIGFRFIQRRCLATRADFYRRIENSVQDIKKAGTFKGERIITSPQSGDIVANGRPVVNFCANNYLGLCNDQSIKAAAKNAIDEYGAGLGSVRFICGTQVIKYTCGHMFSQRLIGLAQSA